MGSHYSQPHGPRHHVLVLLPKRTGNPDLVEGMDYTTADCTICLGSWYDTSLYEHPNA